MDEFGEEPPATPRDDATAAAAREVLLNDYFSRTRDGVFYLKQMQVRLEPVFHWITQRVLGELVDERVLETDLFGLSGSVKRRFYWRRGRRYVAREIGKTLRLVQEFSTEEFGKALGYQAEMLFDSALAAEGVLVRGWDVREYEGKRWVETEHNLDRIYARDGVAYGAELKNTLDYIPRDELDVKLRMCEFFGVRPLFIVRMAPAPYIERVRLRGGFTLVFKYQLYPFGSGGLAKRVREDLGLPADCPRRLFDSTARRFTSWHEKEVIGRPGP
jgi:hypothetical protein